MGDEAISLANYIGGVVQGDAIEFMRRSRSGVSSSMNGALEYTELKVAEKALAWFAPIRADLEARAAAAERERDELRAAQSGIEARVAAECDRLWRIAIWNEHKRRGTSVEGAMREVNEYADARAALTANHSAPVVGD